MSVMSWPVTWALLHHGTIRPFTVASVPAVMLERLEIVTLRLTVPPAPKLAGLVTAALKPLMLVDQSAQPAEFSVVSGLPKTYCACAAVFTQQSATSSLVSLGIVSFKGGLSRRTQSITGRTGLCKPFAMGQTAHARQGLLPRARFYLGGSQSSMRLPSQSFTQPNLPNSEAWCFGSTHTPSFFSAASTRARFATR